MLQNSISHGIFLYAEQNNKPTVTVILPTRRTTMNTIMWLCLLSLYSLRVISLGQYLFTQQTSFLPFTIYQFVLSRFSLVLYAQRLSAALLFSVQFISTSSLNLTDWAFISFNRWYPLLQNVATTSQIKLSVYIPTATQPQRYALLYTVMVPSICLTTRGAGSVCAWLPICQAWMLNTRCLRIQSIQHFFSCVVFFPYDFWKLFYYSIDITEEKKHVPPPLLKKKRIGQICAIANALNTNIISIHRHRQRTKKKYQRILHRSSSKRSVKVG